MAEDRRMTAAQVIDKELKLIIASGYVLGAFVGVVTYFVARLVPV